MVERVCEWMISSKAFQSYQTWHGGCQRARWLLPAWCKFAVNWIHWTYTLSTPCELIEVLLSNGLHASRLSGPFPRQMSPQRAWLIFHVTFCAVQKRKKNKQKTDKKKVNTFCFMCVFYAIVFNWQYSTAQGDNKKLIWVEGDGRVWCQFLCRYARWFSCSLSAAAKLYGSCMLHVACAACCMLLLVFAGLQEALKTTASIKVQKCECIMRHYFIESDW